MRWILVASGIGEPAASGIGEREKCPPRRGGLPTETGGRVGACMTCACTLQVVNLLGDSLDRVGPQGPEYCLRIMSVWGWLILKVIVME
jgi:hypothetical protein